MFDIQTQSDGFSLPRWVKDWVSTCVRIHGDFSSLESRMSFVIQLSKQNVKQQTGGPFAAAVFDMDNQQLFGCQHCCAQPQLHQPCRNDCHHSCPTVLANLQPC